MTMAQVEVLPVERRRRWSRAQKEHLVAASFEPGASVSQVARAAGLHVRQLFRWRKQLCERVAPPDVAPPAPALIPITVMPDEPASTNAAPPARPRRRAGLIEIELGGGRRLRVDRDVDAEALRRVLAVLDER